MKRILLAPIAALVLLPAPARALTSCAQGQVSRLNLGGYHNRGHDPFIYTIINGTAVFIGLSDNKDKARAVLSDMRATLLAALMSGMQVEINTTDGNCEKLTEGKIEVNVTAPSPLPTETGHAPAAGAAPSVP